jgi:galactokinase
MPQHHRSVPTVVRLGIPTILFVVPFLLLLPSWTPVASGFSISHPIVRCSHSPTSSLTSLYETSNDKIDTNDDTMVTSSTSTSSMPPKLHKAPLDAPTRVLVETAQQLYWDKIAYFCDHHNPPAFIVAAPGRVNLIGEHTDYTGGFVLPLAIDRLTVVYGTGYLHTGKGTGATTMRVRCISSAQSSNAVVEERKLVSGKTTSPPDADEPTTWVHYVMGVMAQYMPDLPVEGCTLDMAFAVASDVPLNAGLSSSASLEVAVATLLECFLHDMAYSSTPEADPVKEKALRCQRAENEWAHSPCGIMDQLASCAGQVDHLTLIDCRSLDVTLVPMKHDVETTPPVILVTNSKVTHSIGDGTYGRRRKECNDALEAMQNVPLYHVLSLRDATLQDVKTAHDKMDAVAYKRATHVVSENQRVNKAKVALKMGLWDTVGALMNESHASLKGDFEVSCDEIDTLVDIAQAYPGVYGSRITGGGFGGCTVTLVQPDAVEGLVAELKKKYMKKHQKECDCFVVRPSAGARRLAIDMRCKPDKSNNSK